MKFIIVTYIEVYFQNFDIDIILLRYLNIQAMTFETSISRFGKGPDVCPCVANTHALLSDRAGPSPCAPPPAKRRQPSGLRRGSRGQGGRSVATCIVTVQGDDGATALEERRQQAQLWRRLRWLSGSAVQDQVLRRTGARSRTC